MPFWQRSKDPISNSRNIERRRHADDAADAIRSLELADEKVTEIRVDRVRLIAAGGDDAYACARTTVA